MTEGYPMKRRKTVMGPAERVCNLLFRRLITAVAAGLLFVLWINSSITIVSNGRTYSQNIVPFRQGDRFEESSLFTDILREEISSLTRNAVIRSQLETDGVYNGQRLINIARYAHRQQEVYESGAEAEFFLDDLVKWGNFGFVTESVYATEEEWNACFREKQVSFQFAENSEDAEDEEKPYARELETLVKGKKENTLSMQMISLMANSLEEYMENAQRAGKTVREEDVVRLQILVPRYLSAEDRDLAEYADSMDEYIQLREDLKTTSGELFYNFSEYSESKGQFLAERTNVRYCYRMNVDGEIRYFSNLEDDFGSMETEEINAVFREMGPYVFYSGDRSEIETNTSVSADEMKQELSWYQYAFGDETRVWLAVDAAYPAVDMFVTARNAFEGVMPVYWYLMGAFLLLSAGSILLLVRLTGYEGRAWSEDLQKDIIVQRASDRIYTELFGLLGILFTGACVAGAVLGYRILAQETKELLHTNWMPVVVGMVVWLTDTVVMFFYLGVVRRYKARTLWKDSLCRAAGTRIRWFVLLLYDNSHILLRDLVPFMGLLLINLALGACDIWGLLVASLLDVAAILILYRKKRTLEDIIEATQNIGRGDLQLKIDTRRMHGENKTLAEAVNGLGNGISAAVEKSMKDERLRTDLITNVSHDIKTPLTSIINFVKLLKREHIEDERIAGYIEVLDQKSQRLKQLTDDLVEASKISSGNISLQMEKINFTELLYQTCGEFSDKLAGRCLEPVLQVPERPVYIEADPRRIWRVAENLFSNVCKYALEGTRVYLDLRETEMEGNKYAVFSMKNISAQALNIDAAELTERFIRGDISRSTEGSGLGLSIAKNLTTLQSGEFEIYLDGDLFKVIIRFPVFNG